MESCNGEPLHRAVARRMSSTWATAKGSPARIELFDREVFILCFVFLLLLSYRQPTGADGNSWGEALVFRSVFWPEELHGLFIYTGQPLALQSSQLFSGDTPFLTDAHRLDPALPNGAPNAAGVPVKNCRDTPRAQQLRFVLECGFAIHGGIFGHLVKPRDTLKRQKPMKVLPL